ncbi:MAG: TlpA family protein disulfide reductase [Proteobacteria bacterium]|nr:TlpA family protein disulfide reductase [Pseudomonadota bacterium]
MGGKKQYTVIALLFALLFFFGCEEGGNSAAEKPAPAAYAASAEAKGYVGAVGDPAVDFTLTTFSGETFSLSGALGAPVVINLWASWCGPCKYEAPELQRSYESFKGSGVRFVGVALQDAEENSRDFIEHFGWTFPSGPDSTGEIMTAYRAMAIPMTYIVDGTGTVSYIHVGAISEVTLKRELERLL